MIGHWQNSGHFIMSTLLLILQPNVFWKSPYW